MLLPNLNVGVKSPSILSGAESRLAFIGGLPKENNGFVVPTATKAGCLAEGEPKEKIGVWPSGSGSPSGLASSTSLSEAVVALCASGEPNELASSSNDGTVTAADRGPMFDL